MKAKLKGANICKKSLATLVTNSLANCFTYTSCLVDLTDVISKMPTQNFLMLLVLLMLMLRNVLASVWLS